MTASEQQLKTEYGYEWFVDDDGVEIQVDDGNAGFRSVVLSVGDLHRMVMEVER